MPDSNTLDPLELFHLPPSRLVPDPKSAREHSPGQIRKMRASIREFGLLQPILIDENHQVIAGNARLAAALDLGMPEVPCICISHLSSAERRAYAIADNKIAELGTWNEDRLGDELRFLAEQELLFDLEVLGFETAELDFMILGKTASEVIAQEYLDPPVDGLSTTKPGDLWLCGPHRVMCGDATVASDYATLLGETKVDMVFTDPPTNVPVLGHVRSRDSGHREFAEASGEMTAEEFTTFLRAVMSRIATVSRDGSLHYLCMDWRHIGEILTAGHDVYADLLNLCVWNKTNGGMGSFYRSKHELIFVWKHGTAKHLNTIELGRHGRYRTNVWDYAGANSFGAHRAGDLADHPTVKPKDMVMDAILDCTKRGHHVLDPFLGSGTTLLAAERSGRIAYGIENDPAYSDVALRRWQRLTGGTPIHAETGDPWRDPAIVAYAVEVDHENA